MSLSCRAQQRRQKRRAPGVGRSLAGIPGEVLKGDGRTYLPPSSAGELHVVPAPNACDKKKRRRLGGGLGFGATPCGDAMASFGCLSAAATLGPFVIFRDRAVTREF